MRIPIWRYTASGVRKIYESKDWETNSISDIYKLAYGVRLNLILGVAATIEGMTKFYLISLLEDLILKLENENLDDLVNNSSNSVEFGEFLFEITVTKEVTNDTVFIKEQPDISEKINGILNKFSLEGVNSESLENHQKISQLKKIQDIVEESSWGDLVGYFNKINYYKLSVILKPSDNKVYSDIEILFALRNFIIHSNSMNIQIAKGNINLCDTKLDRILEYYKENNYEEIPYEGKYFVEFLVPEKWINRLMKVLDWYINNTELNSNSSVKNMTNIVWKSRSKVDS